MKIDLDSYLAICHSPEVPRVCKSAKRYCPYCARERSVKFFTRDPQNEICNFCFYFDKAAKITYPQRPSAQ